LGIAAVCGGLSLGALYLNMDLTRCEKEIKTEIKNLRAIGSNIDEMVISDTVSSDNISDIAKKISESKIKTTHYLADHLNFVQQIYTPENKKEQVAVKRNLIEVKSSLKNVDTGLSEVLFLDFLTFVTSIGLGLATVRKLYRSAFKPN